VSVNVNQSGALEDVWQLSSRWHRLDVWFVLKGLANHFYGMCGVSAGVVGLGGVEFASASRSGDGKVLLNTAEPIVLCLWDLTPRFKFSRITSNGIQT
jgi:hypothetical protein